MKNIGGSIAGTIRFINRHPLASREKTRAWGRWLRWQIGSRFLKHPVVMPFAEEAVLVVETGMAGATGNIYCGLHDFEDMALVTHILRPGDLFVDVGANVGSYTILACKVAGADCLALEPVPRTFDRLQRNIRVNAPGSSVKALRCALGSQPGSLFFSSDRDTKNQVVDRNYTGPKIEVVVETLDNLLEHKSPVVMKVDVEGFELLVLQGASQTLRQSSLLAVLLEGEDPQIAGIMQSAGFARTKYHPFSRELTSLEGRDPGQNNSLWTRNLKLVAQRCRTAPKIKVADFYV